MASGTRSDRYQKQKSARTQSRILDAASLVIRRDGLSRLTLENVAAAAEVSKGGLLYHFGSKEDLVTSLLDFTLAQADSGLETLTEGEGPGAFARAYLEYVRLPGGENSANASSIIAAAALEEGNLDRAQAVFAGWQDRLINDDGLDPTTALLARVVGDGLWLIDLFGLAAPGPEQRSDLIDAVLALVEAGQDRSADD